MSTEYFFNDKAGGCTGSASGLDDVLDESTAAGGNLQDTIVAGATDRISYRLTTLAGVPNLTTWQAGDYSVTFDVVERGNNIDVDFNPHRVNSGCVSQADFGLSGEIDPPSTGLNTLTVSGVAEQAAAAGDRLRIVSDHPCRAHAGARHLQAVRRRDVGDLEPRAHGGGTAWRHRPARGRG